ncbi:MAG: response regulator transcription factor [Chloroflexota bacterium]
MGTTPLLLLIEGHAAGSESLEPALTRAGYQLRIVNTGAEAIEWLTEYTADLIIFDASTMRSSGIRNCQRIRKMAERTPIIHSRSITDDEDRSAGADIYLQRPYSGRKLLNRVRALLPADSDQEEIVRYGPLTLYRNKRSVEVDGRGEYILTPKLALLLETFIRHPNELLSRRKLMLDVWDTDFIGDTRTLDVHIRWIRECIETDPGKPRYLQTVRGKGYLLSVI